MCFFFKKLKSEEVYKSFEERVPKLKIKGYPEGNVQSEKFKISPYNWCKKESCQFSMKVQYGKWKMEFSFFYDSKEKEVQTKVWFYNLTLDGKNRAVSQELQQSIRKQFQQFTFSFMPSATVVFSNKAKVKKIDEVGKFAYDFEWKWNSSGILNYMTQFKTNEELGIK